MVQEARRPRRKSVRQQIGHDSIPPRTVTVINVPLVAENIVFGDEKATRSIGKFQIMSGGDDPQKKDSLDIAIDAALKTPLHKLIRKARAGLQEGLIMLEHKIEDEYAGNAVAILDAIMPHLEEPPGSVDIHRTMAAFTTMRVLSAIFQWLKRHPEPSPASFATTSRIRAAGHKFVYWAHRLLRPSLADPDDPRCMDAWNVLGRFFYTLFSTPTEIVSSLATHPPMLVLSIVFCHSLHRGFPIIYPDCRPSDPQWNRPDFGSAILFWIAGANTRGLVDAIQSGTVCDPATFARRIIQRMQCFSKVSTIPRLSHHPVEVSMHLNMQYLTAVTHRLMLCDPTMHTIFMDLQVPEAYLSAIASEADKLRFLSDPKNQAGEIVSLAMLPYLWWEKASSKRILARARCLAEGGIFKFIGDLVRAIGNVEGTGVGRGNNPLERAHFTLGYLIRGIIMYTVYPTLIPRAITLIKENVLPVLSEIRSTSHYKESFIAIRSSLRTMAEFLKPNRQERLCDNLFHSTTSGNQQGAATQKEKCEDWAALHRAECDHLSLNRHNRKASRSWYSYPYRRFHANVMRYILESTEVDIRLSPFELNGYFPKRYHPSSDVGRINLLKALDIKGEQFSPVDLDTWVGKVAPFVPEHLRRRFDTFLRMFTSCTKSPDYEPGSLRILESVFTLGEEDVTVIVLLKQRRALPAPKGSLVEAAVMARHFADRGVEAKSHYEFVGSFAFIGKSRGRNTLGDPMLDLGIGLDMSDFGSSTRIGALG
ncbi:hypothetical protein NMY22_g18580 [Coprinellus aureogranulatus]|nr:hypothetical protein NMY22_g18580 [Coprinellus aureogranulatus]